LTFLKLKAPARRGPRARAWPELKLLAPALEQAALKTRGGAVVALNFVVLQNLPFAQLLPDVSSVIRFCYHAFTMHPETPPTGMVFTTALMMALDAGAREISIEILLAALDHRFYRTKSQMLYLYCPFRTKTYRCQPTRRQQYRRCSVVSLTSPLICSEVPSSLLRNNNH
jgi:hypothetical protein